MEDDDRSFATETLDEALLKKHHDMLQRFSACHHGRKSDSPHSSSSSTFESSSSFLSRFADSKRSIESRIASSSSDDSAKIKSDLAEISSSIDDLENLVAANSYFLPSYEIRSSLKSASDLKRSLDTLSGVLLPRKKFSLKTKSSSPTTAKIQKRVFVSPPNVAVVRDSPGFRNKHGETLSKSFKSSSSSSSIGEFTLSDLDSCQVKLIGAVNALFVHGLRNCSVYAGPVIGVVPSLKTAVESDSRRAVWIEEDLKTAGLEEETESRANVDDFLWLRVCVAGRREAFFGFHFQRWPFLIKSSIKYNFFFFIDCV
ncbi:hypothetical protein HID58_093363 [Brassica napus]|uniref:(rape) hypothetical protein n=1 Tax=Brassica napus TaxID=3708 RepID=A0A816IJV6_BRANA|nr:hypothetical protein HID58_093363 [Brassica napus]CAF1710133.1 unnamed protein product [Brassica napus]